MSSEQLVHLVSFRRSLACVLSYKLLRLNLFQMDQNVVRLCCQFVEDVNRVINAPASLLRALDRVDCRPPSVTRRSTAGPVREPVIFLSLQEHEPSW